MRKKLAEVHSEHGWHVGYECTDQILTLIRTEIEKVENHFSKSWDYIRWEDWESCREAILKALGV